MALEWLSCAFALPAAVEVAFFAVAAEEVDGGKAEAEEETDANLLLMTLLTRSRAMESFSGETGGGGVRLVSLSLLSPPVALLLFALLVLAPPLIWTNSATAASTSKLEEWAVEEDGSCDGRRYAGCEAQAGNEELFLRLRLTRRLAEALLSSLAMSRSLLCRKFSASSSSSSSGMSLIASSLPSLST